MSNTWRIGTRKSDLALWQANQVADAFEKLGVLNRLIKIESTGDQNLTQPLYEMGIQGVFTKELDIALLNNQIDLAVHSLKDVPTQLATGIVLAGVLPRGNVYDILAYTQQTPTDAPATIASGSIRRRAQWLHKYPKHRFENLRGNVQTRLQKLEASAWDGAIFAQVGLERLDLLPEKYEVLDWMIPAAAQGAVGVCVRESDTELIRIIQKFNCSQTWKAIQMERQFLRTLEGGCSAPIGALATPTSEGWNFKGGLFSPDGSEALVVETWVEANQWETKPQLLAQEILNTGGQQIMSALSN